MTITLSAGKSIGPEVERLQSRLVELHFLPQTDQNGALNVDGKFGQITGRAVKAFQASQGLTVDGIVGIQTRTALYPPNVGGPAVAPAPSAPQEMLIEPGHIFTLPQLRRIAEVVDTLIPTGLADPFDDQAIYWLVKLIDGALASLIPPGLKAVIQSIDMHRDLTDYKQRLLDSIARRIDIPLLSEERERKVIGWVVDLVCDAMYLGNNMDSALENMAIRKV